MNDTIATIVVTYNRKNLLLENLKSVLSQTHIPDAISIIDNASTDGTQNLLYEEGFIKETPPANLNEVWETTTELQVSNKKVLVNYVRLPRNTGGAGGFHEGIKRAYESGYDWLWLMDDDGKPSKTCLETLLKHKDKALWLSPLVVNKDNPKELFTWINYPHIGSHKYLKTVEDAKSKAKDGLLYNIGISFNGQLIHRKLIKILGNVKKELFISADDTDYFLRAIQKGLNVITVVDAIFYHPKNRILTNEEPIMFGLTKVRVLPDGKRMYYRIRNRTYLYKTYWRIFKPWVSLKVLTKDFLKLTWYYAFTKRDLNGLRNFLRAFIDGLRL